jgi:EAL domain-containing protein (putative c-di-GMP-specific phosphodiesterase class I)
MAHRGFKVWVNVSARQFSDPSFCGTVQRVLNDSGLPATSLGIEITETVLMASTELVEQQFNQLRACGVAIALDDFGTGFSSLGYLTRFPVDRIKVDRSFVAGIGTEPSTSLVSACVALGRSLGLTTVAEGVETSAQVDWLLREDCDAVQGYYFARPMDPYRINNLLRHPEHLTRLPMQLPRSRQPDHDQVWAGTTPAI